MREVPGSIRFPDLSVDITEVPDLPGGILFSFCWIIYSFVCLACMFTAITFIDPTRPFSESNMNEKLITSASSFTYTSLMCLYASKVFLCFFCHSFHNSDMSNDWECSFYLLICATENSLPIMCEDWETNCSSILRFLHSILILSILNIHFFRPIIHLFNASHIWHLSFLTLNSFYNSPIQFTSYKFLLSFSPFFLFYSSSTSSSTLESFLRSYCC